MLSGFGRSGVSAEAVGREVASEAGCYLEARAPVGEHLADQLLIPMALAGGGAFRTCQPTGHTRTNVEIIKRFVDVRIEIEKVSASICEVTVGK